jgi:hypothetical protein
MMAHEIESVAPGLIRVEKDGQSFTGIDTRIPTNSPTLRRFAGQNRGNGWIVREGTLTRWNSIGFVEWDGTIHVYGEVFSGRFLDDVLNDENVDRLEAIARIADAYAALDRNGVEIQPIHTRSIILLDDGGAFVLPADVMQAIREHQDYAEQLRSIQRFNHPDRSPKENIGFFVAVATYYVLTGRYPYDGEDSETLHARIRLGQPVPARYVRFDLQDEVSRELDRALKLASGVPDPTRWAALLKGWVSEGVTQARSEEELAELRKEAGRETARAERAFRRKEGLRKNGRTALIVTVIAIAVLSVPATILRNALRPPLTTGMSPSEVVTAFYTSINALNHSLMEDAVTNGAGGALIREVTSLYVTERQNQAYGIEAAVASGTEMQGSFVDAQAWRDDGMPALSGRQVPYGVANLQLEETSAPEGERRFLVSYERWLPEYPDVGGTVEGPGYLVYLMQDDVRLRAGRKAWVIYSIDTITQNEVDPADLATAP